MTRYDYDGAAEPIKIYPIERKGSEFQVGAPTLFRHPQQNHAAVSSGGISAQICEPLVRGNDPTTLTWINDQRYYRAFPASLVPPRSRYRGPEQ